MIKEAIRDILLIQIFSSNLPKRQIFVLLVVKHLAGPTNSPVSYKDLNKAGEIVYIQPTIHRAVKELKEKGMITTTSNQANRKIKLTDKGLKTCRRLIITMQEIEAKLRADIRQ